ncbi:MAG: type II secretion system F family protein [Candidatus Omnitrophica bacterium]|nr:type II secretion system F family protein [Candidatus Omnitrophota bacterium]
MPKFQYTAKRSPTESVEGVLEGNSRAEVISRLAGMGYMPVRVVEEGAGQRTPAAAVAPISRAQPLPGKEARVPVRHLNQCIRQFASLVRSSVPILRCLAILQEQASHPRLRKILAGLEEDIRQGHTLSEACAKYPRVFSPLFISLVRSGEVGGMLDGVLDRLAVQADREEALRSKVQTSLAYPLFVALVGVATIIFLFTFVIPRLMKLFTFFGSDLPLPTRLLLALMDALSKGWYWLAGGLACLVFVGVLAMRRPEARTGLDYLFLRVPVLGSLIRHLEITRFCRSFGLLLDHGVPILQAADVAIPGVHNRIVRRELTRLPAHLKDGHTLSTGLKKLTIATPFLVNTVAVGEEGGKMGEALAEVSNYYEREVERLLQMAAGLLEPATILLVGGVVGFIVMAVLLPILTMSTIAR